MHYDVNSNSFHILNVNFKITLNLIKTIQNTQQYNKNSKVKKI